MKNLLYKEWRLCMNPQTWIFLFFGLFAIIPQYPLSVLPIFLMSCVSTLIVNGKDANDIFYTASLPIKRDDVVKGKVLFFASLEVVFVLIAGIFIFLSYFLMKNGVFKNDDGSIYTNNITSMNPNIAIIGVYFLTFGIYNIIFCPWWYKNPDKFTAPFFVAMIVGACVSSFFGSALIYIPKMGEYFNNVTSENWYIQLIFTLSSFVIFILLNLLTIKLSQKRFSKVDI